MGGGLLSPLLAKSLDRGLLSKRGKSAKNRSTNGVRARCPEIDKLAGQGR